MSRGMLNYYNTARKMTIKKTPFETGSWRSI